MNSTAKSRFPMKKYLSYLGASLVAIAALSSCNKELTDPNEGIKGGIPFEITAASVDTKTAIDGFATRWVANDAINLFHAKAGSTTYTSDGEFTIANEDLEAKKFKGTLPAALEAGSYDWYAFYPYNSYNKTPAGSSKDDFGYTTIGGTSQTQTGNSSTAHLCGKPCPLYGIATGVASNDAPSIKMNHLASIIEVNVTNNSGEDLTVNSVSFTGTEDIVGTYYINFTQDPVVYTSSGESYVSKTASLSVTDGEAIANGSSATFYIAIKPFTVSSGKLKVAVNGYEKEIEISNKTVFTAGKIKKINFNFNKVVVDYVTLPWTEDFSGDLGIYSLVSTTSNTKTYQEATAGGKSPELLVAKNKGSFSAKVKASAGNYILTFKSNHPDYLSISIDNKAITLTKVSDTEYSLSIPDGVDFFNVTFTNTNDSNTRLDDIALVSDDRTALATPVVTASLHTKDASITNSIDVSWNSVENAGSYVVTATPAEGAAVSNTVAADESTTTYAHTITGLAYETEYTISVTAISSDISQYMDSEPGICTDKIMTGIKYSAGGFLTTTLSNANITAVANPNNSSTQTTGYRELIYTDDNGFEYSAYAISTFHSKATYQNCYIQIKKYEKNTAYYVKLPDFKGNIKSIHLVVSGSSKAMDGGGNTATIFFSSSNSTSAAGANIVSGTGGSEITIDASSLNLNTGYLTASGAVRIWEITVEYSE